MLPPVFVSESAPKASDAAAGPSAVDEVAVDSTPVFYGDAFNSVYSEREYPTNQLPSTSTGSTFVGADSCDLWTDVGQAVPLEILSSADGVHNERLLECVSDLR